MNKNNIKIISIFFIALFVGTVYISYAEPTLSQAQHSINIENAPEWQEGTIWTYQLDQINIEISEETYIDLTLSVNGGLTEIPLTVEKVTDDHYELSFDTKIEGEISVETTLNSIPLKGIIKNGLLMKPTITGMAIVQKEDLGLKEVTIQFSGCFVTRISKPLLLPAIRIPLSIEITTEFSTPCSLINFPISIDDSWGIPETTITVDGKISSIYLRPLHFIHRITRFFQLIPDEFTETSDLINDLLPEPDIGEILMILQDSNTFEITETPELVYCSCYETITVPAGSFDSYKIELPAESGFYCYSPTAKNIVSIQGNIQQFLPYIEDIKMELVSMKE